MDSFESDIKHYENKLRTKREEKRGKGPIRLWNYVAFSLSVNRDAPIF